MIIDIFINPAKKCSINNKIKLFFLLNFNFTNKNFEASKPNTYSQLGLTSTL